MLSDAPARYLVQPKRYFYPVLLATEVTRSPARVLLFDEPYVVYRDRSGKPVAHLDRCPHRSVPLSSGRCQSDDTLECAYHGWRFRSDGACTLIPGSLQGPKETHRVPTFVAAERYGIVWLCPHQEGPVADIPALSSATQKEYSQLLRRVSFAAGLHAVVENALDVPHTAILHRGLFRTGARNRVKVVMRRYSDRAEAEFIGEPSPSGLLGKLLAFGGSGRAVVRHWDRFFVPNLLQVEYQLGERFHLLVSGFCAPRHSNLTDVFAVVCLRTPYPRWLSRLLMQLVLPIAMRVYRQDAEILRLQYDAIARAGQEGFMSTELDVLGGAVTRLLKEAVDSEKTGRVFSASSAPTTSPDPPREVTETELDA